MPAPVGFNRVYVQLESFSYDGFLAALAAGRSFTTNGPIVELVVDGEHGPGARLAREAGDTLPVTATIRSRRAIETVELIVNGDVVATTTGATLTTDVQLDDSSWIAVRAFESTSGEAQFFAHTSPVYVSVDGRPIRRERDIRYLLDKVDQLIDDTASVNGFANETERADTLATYRRARTVYLDRLR